MSKDRLIIALFGHYMYLLKKTKHQGRLGKFDVMQKKKAAENQVQQEMSSGTATMGRGGWAPTREPMTGAQADSLRRLAEEIKEPQAYNEGLSRSEAARRIDRLRERLRLGELPPHTD